MQFLLTKFIINHKIVSMIDTKSVLFQPAAVGPLTLRNRTIRAAAFEGMCPDGRPSKSLIDYHTSVAAGGIGMTTVAYVAVTDNGRSFSHQASMKQDVVPEFRKLTDSVHREGAAASVQLGHCGNMADRNVSGQRALSPSGKFNIYGMIKPRKMNEGDIEDTVAAFGNAVTLARESGFDAVEIHAGHGYLISQFLSPYTNRRSDRWGGPLENRMRFMREVMKEVRLAAGNDLAVIVKTNMRDGFRGGVDLDESIEIAGTLEEDGADALVLSGGFVSKTPMYVMRGDPPFRELAGYQSNPFMKAGMLFFDRFVIERFPFTQVYFLEDALAMREAVKLPLVYVGGALTRENMETVLENGFEFIALARALVAEPDFINRVDTDPKHVSPCVECGPCNRCIATMYQDECRCLFLEEEQHRH